MDDVTSFSAIAIFLRADWVVKAVIIGLACASLYSWAIIIERLFRFSGLNRNANRFDDVTIVFACLPHGGPFVSLPLLDRFHPSID